MRGPPPGPRGEAAEVEQMQGADADEDTEMQGAQLFLHGALV